MFQRRAPNPPKRAVIDACFVHGLPPQVAKANEKVVKLSEHIEKLMMHLKHEVRAGQIWKRVPPIRSALQRSVLGVWRSAPDPLCWNRVMCRPYEKRRVQLAAESTPPLAVERVVPLPSHSKRSAAFNI